MLRGVFVFLALVFVQSPPPAFDVSAITASVPVPLVDLDGALGEPRQLAWSDDGTQLYVMVATHQDSGDVMRHYLVSVSERTLHPVDTQPPWAVAYWAFKSDRSAPGLPAAQIEIVQTRSDASSGSRTPSRFEPTTMAPGNMDTGLPPDAETVTRLMLYGAPISEFVNQPFVPGLQFSWGPTGTGAVAFIDRDGRLVLLGPDQHRQVIRGVKSALLPAWATDGSRLAYLRKAGHKKYALMMVRLSR